MRYCSTRRILNVTNACCSRDREKVVRVRVFSQGSVTGTMSNFHGYYAIWMLPVFRCLPHVCGGRELQAGGVTLLQYRNKAGSRGGF